MHRQITSRVATPHLGGTHEDWKSSAIWGVCYLLLLNSTCQHLQVRHVLGTRATEGELAAMLDEGGAGGGGGKGLITFKGFLLTCAFAAFDVSGAGGWVGADIASVLAEDTTTVLPKDGSRGWRCCPLAAHTRTFPQHLRQASDCLSWLYVTRRTMHACSCCLASTIPNVTS
jgi:hypothetical protein